MDNICCKKQKIVRVEPDSPAARNGIIAGDILLSINGEPVKDLIDYEYLTAGSVLTVHWCTADGKERSVKLRKRPEEPLGLSFERSLMDVMRSCCNRCVFCFIDQMPRDVRSSLLIKDDDWRLSFIMGNYVTLTNVSDTEFDRILKRHVSPLYISVHATDPILRSNIMGNTTAGKLMDRLTRLKAAGLTFHAQIVCCPGLNDRDILDKTLNDLLGLWPSAQSVAIVPVGLTKYRDGLTALRPYDAVGASGVIRQVTDFQAKARTVTDSDFAYLSDEWYLISGSLLPSYESYGDFPQIENGVGLLRLFEDDFRYALSLKRTLSRPRAFSVAGGEAAYPFFSNLYNELEPYGITTDLYPIHNDYFGGNVHVAGLITGGDLVRALKDKLKTDKLLIPSNMLREKEDVFLDGLTLKDVSDALRVEVIPFAGGEELIDIMFDETGTSPDSRE